MKSLFVKLDLMNMKPYLFLNGKERKQTVVGGLLSIVNAVFILTISIYFFIKLSIRTSSNITYNLIPLANSTSSLTANFTGKPFIIALKSTLMEIINDEGLYSIVGQTTEFYLDQSKQMTGKRIFHEMEKCNIDKHFGNYTNLFKDVPEIDRYFCLKDPNTLINVNGTYGNPSKPFSFQIQKCINSTLNVICVPDVSKKLENINVAVMFLDSQIMHDQTDYPQKVYLRSDTITASSSVYKRIFYYLRHVVYTTDIGYIFEDLTTFEFYQFPSPREIVDLRTEGILPGNFINVFFIMDNQVDSYKKEYIKLQNFLANVGGIIKFFNQISIFLIFAYQYKSFYSDVCKVYSNSNSHLRLPNVIQSLIKDEKGNLNLKNNYFQKLKPLISKVLIINNIYNRPMILAVFE